MSAIEEQLALQITAAGLPDPVREHRFTDARKWRFDFAWPEHKVAVEVEGGTWGTPVTCHKCRCRVKRRLKSGRWVDVREGGRHTRGRGFAEDCRKYNTAALLGWRVLRVTSEMVKGGEALDAVSEALTKGDQI